MRRLRTLDWSRLPRFVLLGLIGLVTTGAAVTSSGAAGGGTAIPATPFVVDLRELSWPTAVVIVVFLLTRWAGKLSIPISVRVEVPEAVRHRLVDSDGRDRDLAGRDDDSPRR